MIPECASAIFHEADYSFTMEIALFLVSGRADFSVILRGRLNVSQTGTFKSEQQISPEAA